MTDPNGFKILGREPVFFTSVIEAALALLLTFGVWNLDQKTVAVIVATVAAAFGLVTAYATRTTLYSALIGFAKAVMILAVTFGAPLTDNQTAAVMAFISLVAGAYLRDRTSPVLTVVSAA